MTLLISWHIVAGKRNRYSVAAVACSEGKMLDVHYVTGLGGECLRDACKILKKWHCAEGTNKAKAYFEKKHADKLNKAAA